MSPWDPIKDDLLLTLIIVALGGCLFLIGYGFFSLGLGARFWASPLDYGLFIKKILFVLGIILLCFKAGGALFILTDYDEFNLFVVASVLMTTCLFGWSWFRLLFVLFPSENAAVGHF